MNHSGGRAQQPWPPQDLDRPLGSGPRSRSHGYDQPGQATLCRAGIGDSRAEEAGGADGGATMAIELLRQRRAAESGHHPDTHVSAISIAVRSTRNAPSCPGARLPPLNIPAATMTPVAPARRCTLTALGCSPHPGGASP